PPPQPVSGPVSSRPDLPTSLGPPASPSSTLASPPTQHAPAAIPPSHTMVTRLRAGVIQPKTRTDGTVRYPLPHGLLSVGVTHEPTCFSQAHKHAEWRSAMTEEINALLKNNTWSLVPHSPLHAPVGCKWVFRIKRNSDGSIERYKARLVAKGFHQQPGLDFTETFSPVVKPATVRTVLSLAVSRGWSLRQLDVKNAFLHGFLDEDVYMTQPPGLWIPLGLTMFASSIRPYMSGGCFSFIYHHAHHTIFLLLYVDDIVITGSHSGFLQQFISALGCEFEIKDLGALSYFLGLQVTTSNGCLHLSQLQYAHDLLKRSHMLDCKPTSTPLAAKISLSASDGDLLSSPTSYRELVGCLQYLTITRPDLAFAVNTVAQYMSAPRTSHMIAVKRILRYIKGTLDFGLTLCPQSSPARLTAYSDADWAGCPDSRRSTTGYLIYLGNNLISWCSKKQPTVSRSSTESEYRSLAHACAETTWLSYLLVELGVHLQFPITLHCDNLSATYLAANPVFHARTRHIELDYHFVREKVSLGSH
ncbi:Far-red impaired responsive family protein, partial [Prunus dulcis]